MERIVIFGASGHAKVCIDIFEKLGGYEIIGLLDAKKPKGLTVFEYPVLGGMDQVSHLVKHIPSLNFFVAIGDNWLRFQVVQGILEIHPKAKFINAIHPDAIIGKGVKLGQGVMIMAGSIVNADSSLEDFTIVNTKSSVGHESIIKKFSSLAPNCTLAGNVEVGEYSAISLSTTISNGRKIGEHSVIGAGSVLIKDAEGLSVYYGIPAKLVRFREKGDRYL
ncbi:MAG: acetyltransferase [Muricauda sp.]|nr:acetyltransferase [Allomuricauda sp.]MBO6844074.1 acetyltransferase [Allomuricauda sp.]